MESQRINSVNDVTCNITLSLSLFLSFSVNRFYKVANMFLLLVLKLDDITLTLLTHSNGNSFS